MTISFMTVLDQSAWSKNVGGWRCEVLKIPGARIDAVFADNARLDPAWYEPDSTHGLLRWGRDATPPEQATAAIVFDKPLSTAEVTLFWKKLAILMPIITALLGLGATKLITGWEPATPISEERILRYEVQGMVHMDTPAIRPQDIQLCMRPPDFVIRPNGVFEGNVSVVVNKANKLVNPPKLLIDSGVRDRTTAVAYILNKGEKVPHGAVDYEIDIDHEKRRIDFRKPVEFQRAPKEGYSPTSAQAAERLNP